MILIEKYDFREIINKYYLENSIISLSFKMMKKLRVLSKITEKENIF